MGAGEKQFGIAQDLVEYSGEEPKVSQERVLVIWGGTRVGECRGEGMKGVGCLRVGG